MKSFIVLILSFISFASLGFPIPKDNIATFDIIRKNKIIGSAETSFSKSDENLFVKTVINIKVKVLFISAYKFSQTSVEKWSNNEFIEFDGHTQFEDEREYFIKGKDTEEDFVATGMDGELILDKNIMPLNYWNKAILNEKKVFDMQKGIVREITVKKQNDEIIQINNKEIISEKYILNASTNPKDKGPFPEYTLWYSKSGELLKFKFINWRDKKEVTTLRNNLNN